MKFPSIKDFIKNVISPDVVNLKNVIGNTKQEVTKHIQDTTNPHKTKIDQIATISTAKPVSHSVGSNGDMWIVILPTDAF